MHENRILPLLLNGQNGQANGNHVVPRDEPPPEPQPPEPMTSLEERQALLAHHVRLIARKRSNALLVFGHGGLGKTVCITETLASEGIVPVTASAHLTPLGLYQLLFFHRADEVLLIEDAEGIFNNLVTLGILRASTWGSPRVVTYVSSQLNGVPSRFEFDSRIILTANTLPKKNAAFQALLSRLDTFHMTATNDEVIAQMRAWARRGFHSLIPAQVEEVVDFIASEGATRPLSLRLYQPSLVKREYAAESGIDWRELVRCQLQQLASADNVPQADSRAAELLIMGQAVAAHPDSVKEQEAFFRQRTGKSRASFFRVKREYEVQQSQQQASNIPPQS